MPIPDFHNFAGCAPVMLIAVSLQGELMWANNAWCGYTGVSQFPTQAHCAVNSQQHAALQKLLLRMQESPRQMSCELQLRRHDEHYRWFELILTPCFSEGQMRYLAGALFDMTDAKMIEEQMMELNDSLEEMVEEQTRHLKQANDELKATQSQMLQNEKMASIGQLAAGVAHEINNPMGFITSNFKSLGKHLAKIEEYLQAQDHVLKVCEDAKEINELRLLRKKLKVDYLLEDGRDLIEESLEGAGRVQQIVLNLKSFSRVDRAEVQSADLNECIDSTLAIVWNELKYKVSLEKDYGQLDPLRCLPQQLNQVFLNILINAGQAIEKQGVIKIKTWQDSQRQFVAISDSGKGIPAEIRHKIFEPFFTTKEAGKGTGLGMSISYDIIKKHGGEICLDSELGVGTTFTLAFPRVGIAQIEEVS